MEPQLNQFIGCDKPFDDAKVVLFGAPYDSTTSFRPGTRFGPAAMRAESFGIETYSMLQDRDIAEDASVFDSGDLELPFGAPDAALDMIESRASEILGAGKIPFLLGGEHLVTLGSIRAVAKRYPNLHIVHFDAHADLRDDYLGVKLSHACVCSQALPRHPRRRAYLPVRHTFWNARRAAVHEGRACHDRAFLRHDTSSRHGEDRSRCARLPHG